MTRVSVVHVYYAAARLPELLRRRRVVAAEPRLLDCEFIFVDDASTYGLTVRL